MSQDNDIRDVHQAIDFGFVVEAFLTSDVGRYLIARAEDEIADAVGKLKTIDPNDAPAIQSLQNIVHRAESIQYWLAEAVQEGMNAQRELMETSQ